MSSLEEAGCGCSSRAQAPTKHFVPLSLQEVQNASSKVSRLQRFHVLFRPQEQNSDVQKPAGHFSDLPVLVFITLAEIRHTPCSN